MRQIYRIYRVQRTKQLAKNTSGKTKNNFTARTFPIIFACVQKIKKRASGGEREARRHGNCLALEMKIESKAKDASASRHPYSRTINNKSAFISSWELFAAVDVCEIKVAWHSWIIIIIIFFLSSGLDCISYLSRPWYARRFNRKSVSGEWWA